MDNETNLERLHTALEPLSIPERRVALDYLLGAVSTAVAPDHWDRAMGWAMAFAQQTKDAGRL